MTDKNKYVGERTNPKYPVCARSQKLQLVFNGEILFSRSGVGGIVFNAVSGRPNEKGSFDYSIERQKISGVGAIPEGEYWIQPSELQENAWYRVRNPRFAWGEYWITIHPYPTTQTYGRGGFFIHGGDTPGSAGCIDLTNKMNDFVTALKKVLARTDNCFVPLTVKYAK